MHTKTAYFSKNMQIWTLGIRRQRVTMHDWKRKVKRAFCQDRLCNVTLGTITQTRFCSSCSSGSYDICDDTWSVCHCSLRPSVAWGDSGIKGSLQAVIQHTQAVAPRQIQQSLDSRDNNMSIILNASELLGRRLHLCDRVETEEDEGENMTLKHPFTNDKHLPPFPIQHPIIALLLLRFIQPSSLSFPLFNGWVVIFPWDSGGGELSRTRCFIMPNKGTCSDHLVLGAVMKHRNQALATRQHILTFFFFLFTHLPIFHHGSDTSS